MSDETVTVSREHYNAVRRVLKLLALYLGAMPNYLHGAGGGMMTTGELLEHAMAAYRLMPIKKRRARR
jgi:hypothetical protein